MGKLQIYNCVVFLFTSNFISFLKPCLLTRTKILTVEPNNVYDLIFLPAINVFLFFIGAIPMIVYIYYFPLIKWRFQESSVSCAMVFATTVWTEFLLVWQVLSSVHWWSVNADLSNIYIYIKSLKQICECWEREKEISITVVCVRFHF